MKHRLFATVLGLLLVASEVESAPPETSEADTRYEYKLLATSKTSTMEKELNEAAEAGFRFEGVMGGETSFGGKEVVAILSRAAAGPKGAYGYKLLATNKTSTMQKEMSEAAAAGYHYRGQTVSETLFGGQEVIVIMEQSREAPPHRVEYKLLATNKTSTMQKELQEAADAGFVFRGVTVGKSAFGGREVIVITERVARR